MHFLLAVHVLLAAIMLSFSTYAATELYQWVDENGVRHFSEYPPEHKPDLQAVDVHGTPIISGEDTQPPVVTGTKKSAPSESQPKDFEEVTTAPQKDQEKCERARSNIAQIQQYGRVKAKDPETGEMRYMAGEEKTVLIKRWQDHESAFC